MEFIGITTAETKNPRKVLPKAINEYLPVLIFLIGALFVIMPSHHGALQRLKAHLFRFFTSRIHLCRIINFVVLTASVSALNNMIYLSGRTSSLLNLMVHSYGIFKNFTHRVPLYYDFHGFVLLYRY